MLKIPVKQRSPMCFSAAIRSVLEVDHVLTTAQIERLGLSIKNLGFPTSQHSTRPHIKGTKEVVVTFVALNARILERGPGRLSHLAGTASLRHALEIQPEDWALDLGALGERPDAVAQLNGWTTAVEYDAGYAAKVVRRKIRAFREEFEGLIWATPSRIRALHLRETYPDLTVHVVDYWSAPLRKDQT